MEIEFDFRREESRIFGPILRPVAKVTFINDEKEVLESAYVDSGADVSVIPKSVGDLLGFKVEDNDAVTEMKGVGERGIPVIIKKLKIRIGEKLIDARVAWCLIEEVPILLGRTDIFNLFDICLKKNEKTVFRDSD